MNIKLSKKEKELIAKSPAMALAAGLLDHFTPTPTQAQKIKRKPLLIDEVLANTHKELPKEERRKVQVVQARLQQAKVFKFDEDAAIYAAQMMRDYPEAIAHDVDFAIPPFPQMYIEFPFPKFYDILTPEEMRVSDPLPLKDQDQDVGYFYDGPSVYVMSRTADSKRNRPGMILPLRFRMNRAFTYDEEVELIKHLKSSRLGIDAFFWGSCYKKLIERNDYASMRALREHHSCEVWYGDDGMPPNMMAYLLHTNAGDLRSIIAMLLFLNRTKDVQEMDEIRGAPGFVRAKPRTLIRHNVIHIKLDPAPLLKKVFLDARTTGGWRREHDVRGHFCHDRTYHAAHHEHDMKEIDHQHWKCRLCGGAKWWRKAHHRGSSKAGQVLTAYEVEK
jgi:hypothetical protein